MLQNYFFWPEHAEIRSVYLLNQVESILRLIDIKKGMTPAYIIVCVCITSCSFDKKIAHCCFYCDEIKNKKLRCA